MPNESRITVSVVSHGQRAMVARVVEQLAGLNNRDIKTVVVTHNLADENLPNPPNAAFDLIQIHNPKPLGFAANHNQAFQHCQTPWFAVLNPDLEFSFGDPFPSLLAAGEADSKLGMLAPLLIQPDTMEAEPNRGMVTPVEIIRRRLPGWKPPDKPTWLVGAFLFIRSDVFASVGGFDERYRLYCEDVDLSLRIQKNGMTVDRTIDAKVIHLTQRKSQRNPKYLILHLSSIWKLWFEWRLK
ncbi:MAG TPA: glycosyltransferase [Halothiobacillus sp.]|nr:glycosyltransferase [Halothiobacillus sp.]